MKTSRAVAVAICCHLATAGCSGDSLEGGTEGAEQVAQARGRAVEPDEVPEGVWDRDPGLRWSLEPDLRIGAVEGGGEDVFGRIRNLVLDDSGGVWVYDLQAFELRHFNGEGEHVISTGRQGQGPGEFSGNACARPGADDEVWVETETIWHRFDGTGKLLGTFPTPIKMACAQREWLPDGRYLAADAEFNWETREVRPYLVVLAWREGRLTPADTIEAPDLPEPETVTFVSTSGGSRSTRAIPFAHVPGWRLERGGQFLIWNGGGGYDIRLESLEGDTVRRMSRDYSPVQIEGEVRRQAIEEFDRPGWRAETEFDASRVPTVYPPFSSVRLAEDGSVWVRRQTGDEETTWEVFGDGDGYMGAVELPETLEGVALHYIGDDYAWGVLRDALNVEYVVRARIIKPDQ